MSASNLVQSIALLAARVCERSSLALKLLRRFDFKGKGLIVQRIRQETLGDEVVAECKGIRYRLNLHDDIQRQIYFNIYERRDLGLALELIPQGGTCIDIGANNGAFALQFARKVGSRGVVHCFEPDPAVFACLIYNAALNGLDSVLKCYPQAVSNGSGTVPFYRSEEHHSGWGSLLKFEDIATVIESVPVVTLDDFVASQKLSNVDFLKVDVEAHEPELLEGARSSLGQQLFRYVLIEFNGIRLAERGKSVQDIVAPLAMVGYVPFRSSGSLVRQLQAGNIAPETVCTNLWFSREKEK